MSTGLNKPGEMPGNPLTRGIKRLLDMALAATGLIVLSPVMAVTAIAVRISMGRPVIFCHGRIGYREGHFRIFKYRTMKNSFDSAGNPLPDEQRVTKLGILLRKSSLDELPELWNVLRGEMSLVGPRPLLERYQPYYTDLERKRFWVRPGITGLAQISGRNHLGWDARLSCDVQYVENWSLWLDITIIFKTVATVLFARGIVVAPATEMLNFDDERIAKLSSYVESEVTP